MTDTPAIDTRERIQLAARKLFLRDGFAKTDVNALVKEAQTSKREFYKCFATREEAFLETVKGVLGEGGTIAAIPDLPPDELLPRLARSFYKSNLNADSIGLFRASIVASIKSSELDAVVYNARANATRPLADRFAEWQQSGAMTFDDPELAALRFGFLATDGLNYIMGGTPFSDEDIARHADAVTGLFLHGCASDRLRAAPSRGSITVGCLRAAAPAPPLVEAKPSRLGPEQWEAIYDAAWLEFAEHGFSMSSVETIARAGGTARSTIYRRHPTKIDLFNATAIRVIEKTYLTDITIPASAGTVEAALTSLADQILALFLKPDSIRIHKILIGESDSIPDTTFKIYGDIKRLLTHSIMEFFDRFGEFFKFTRQDAQFYAWLLFIAISFGGRMLFRKPTDRHEHAALAHNAVKLFLFGVRKA